MYLCILFEGVVLKALKLNKYQNGYDQKVKRSTHIEL